jgi:uncharacterized protein YhaN
VRIDRIDLIRFGHFANHVIELPPTKPDYYLIYGDNEVGKSTLLRGISALFFGVPGRTPDVHSCKASELRIGATISDHEKSLSFRRRKGTSGTVLNADDAQIQDATLSPFLQELDRERFEQFFGLNHQRLREGGEELLRGKGDIGSALFQAAGLLDLRNLLEELNAEAGQLFSASSRANSTKTINCGLQAYRQAKSEVVRLAISGKAVKDKQAELEAAKENVDKLKAESQSRQQELVRLRRIASNKPDVARLEELRRELVTLELLPTLPTDARKQRDEAAAALVAATSQIETLAADVAQRKDQVKRLPTSSFFKTHEKEIQELNTETSAYTHSVADRVKRTGEQNDAIQRAEADWKRIWPDRPISDAETLRTVYARKAEIFALITEHARLSAAANAAEEQLRSAHEERERLQEELARQPVRPDPANLIATIEQAKSLGDTGHALAKLKSDVERLTADAVRDLRVLRCWSGTLQELDTLKTPLLTTIERYARDWETGVNSRRDLTARLSNVVEMISEKHRDLHRLAAQVGKAGENELSEIRARRDQLWQLIRASAFDKSLSPEDAQRQSGSSEQLPETFTEHLRRADQTADLRFANAKDVAIHDQLVKEIDSARLEQQRIERELERLDGEEDGLRQRWAGEWRELGSAPLSPLEMKEWMQARKAILDRLQQAREKDNDHHLLHESASNAAALISARLIECGSETMPENESLSILLRVAEGFAKEIVEHKRSVNDIHRRLQSLSLEKCQQRVDECTARLLEWSRKWSPILTALLLPEVSTPDQVAETIALLEKVYGNLQIANDKQYRVRRISENIELFERRVSQVVSAIDASLSALPPEIAVKELHSRLVEIGRADTERTTLEAQNVRDEKSIANCRSRLQTASGTLTPLRKLANCEDDQQLEAAIAAAEERSEKREEYDHIALGLIQRNAVPEIKQIEEEASGYELDLLHSEIVSSEDRLKTLQDEFFNAGSRHRELTTEFERLQASDESTFQAQKAEDALARVRPAVGQYLRLRLASGVLQRAIESYRDKHQGPVLKRASELFTTLTLGDHCGLTTGFADDDKPVLVAIRKNREQVNVEGLSDGTRDQLYLALRIAGIEHHVETVAPCPVIFDDVLINSDDARASAALQVIGSLAKHTQVLFFTHHKRLAELGAEAGAQMIELESGAVGAIA